MEIQDIKDFIEGSTRHPEEVFDIIISCTKALGWDVGIEEGREIVRGLTIGTEDYIAAYFKEDK